MKNEGKGVMALHGPATHFDDPGPKMEHDRKMYGGTGEDGINGNAGSMDKAVEHPRDPRTTGDGSGHWSKH